MGLQTPIQSVVGKQRMGVHREHQDIGKSGKVLSLSYCDIGVLICIDGLRMWTTTDRLDVLFLIYNSYGLHVK